jgi:hypothetical protein
LHASTEPATPATRLFVMGRHHHPSAVAGRHHLDHNVERAIRALQRPILVASAQFRSSQRFAIAFDGSATARKMVETVAAVPCSRVLLAPAKLLLAGPVFLSGHDDVAAGAGQLPST